MSIGATIRRGGSGMTMGEAMTDPSIKFLVRLKGLVESANGYSAAYIHVSSLPSARRTRDRLSDGLGVLSNLKRRYRNGDIYLMRNADIVFLVRNAPGEELASAGRRIREVFLGKNAPTGDEGEGDIVTLFQLPQDFDSLMELAEQAAGLTKLAMEPALDKQEINLATLAQIKEELQKVDISTMLFNQPVYDISEAKPRIRFHEIYVSVRVLEEMFCPGLSLTSKRWLFTDLTQDLDGAVLRFLTEPDSAPGIGGMSLNLNLSTLASDRFVSFDTELDEKRRRSTVLELNKTDVFENMRLYRELAPFLRQRGYSLLLDGLSFLNIAAIDFAGLPCDYAKLFWSGEAAHLDDDAARYIAQKIKKPDMPRFLLAHCDSAESLRFARSMGIDLVQGRLVDHMVKKGIPFS